MLLEVGEQVSTSQYHLIASPIAWNFLAKGRAATVIPSSGVDYNIVKARIMEAGFAEDEINRLLRVYTLESSSAIKEPYIAAFEGKGIEEDYRNYLNTEDELMNETGQPVLRVIGADFLIAYYGTEAAMKIWNRGATRVREKGTLGIIILKPGYPEASKTLGVIADIHLKVTREHGALLFYGIKPRTNLHIIEIDTSKGYPLPELVPII